ncbi:MAG: glycerol-3-phosphate dehydrogenase/oxidase [Pseudomonadota bacterium]
MAFSERDRGKLASTEYEVLIVGGGISGAWLALHCAQSGYKTALIDRGDYAAETSSSSSKLLHGGIRYLQQFQFDKVRESAMERAHYLYAAPHLSSPVPFVIPTYRDIQRSKWFLNCGMLAYRVLCAGQNKIIGSKEQELPPVRSISAAELNQLCDLGDEPHTGAVVFYERHMLNSERMVLSILQTAAEHGADIINYVEAKRFLTENDSVVGVQAHDVLDQNEFEIKAKLVINAAGPWIDKLNQGLKSTGHGPSISGFAIGSHIISRQISDHAIALTTKHQSDAKIDRGGRHVFIIPWRGHSLIGTSYDEIDNPNGDLSIQSSHVEQLLEAINEALPSARLTSEDLVSGYSGLYPLHTENIQSTVYQGSGEYQIIDHQRSDGISGVVTALGAKFTTGRKLSALTMRVVSEHLGKPAQLKKSRLQNAQFESLRAFTEAKLLQYQHLLPEKTIQHLVSHYGSDIDDLLTSIGDDEAMLQQITPSQPDILGQVSWAIEREQAMNLEDVLFRRTSLGFFEINETELGQVASLMAKKLSWSDELREQQLSNALARLQKTRATLDAAQSKVDSADG